MVELALKIDPSSAVQGARTVRSSLDDIANAADRTEGAIEGVSASVGKMGRGADGTRTVVRSIEEVNGTARTAEQGINRVRDAMGRFVQSGSGVASGVRAANDELNRQKSILDQINRATGVTGGRGGVGRGDDVKAYGDELDRLRAKFSPLAKISQDYTRSVNEIREAHRLGAISAREMDAAVQEAGLVANAQQRVYTRWKEGLEDVADGARLTGNQVLNLGRQANDAATMLASGSSLTQVLATQLGQVYGALEEGPGGVRGSLAAIGEAAKSAGSTVISALGPIGITFGVVTAAAAAFAFAVRKDLPDATETLKTHEKVLGRVREQYDGVGAVLDDIAKRSDVGINIDLGATGRDLAESLRAQVKQVEREFVGGGGFLGTIMFGTDDTSQIPSLAKLGPIAGMLDELRAAFREPNPDVVALSQQIVAFNQSLDSAYDRAGDDTEMRKAIEAARNLIRPVLETATALDQNAAAATGAARATADYADAMETLRGLVPDVRTNAERINDAFAKAAAGPADGDEMVARFQRQKALAADTAGAVDLLNAARAEGAAIGLGEEAKAVAAVEQEYGRLKLQYAGNADALIILDQLRQQSVDNVGRQTAFDRDQEAAKEAEAAAKRATDEAQRHAEATRSRIAGIDQTVAAQRMELELLGASEGASAALRFEFQALTAAKQAAAAAGGVVSDAELAKIREASDEVGRLTNQIAAKNAAQSAVDTYFPFEAASREAERLGGYIADLNNGLSQTERTALQLQIDQGFIDAAEAAERLRTGGKKAAEDIGQSFIENVGDVFADIFGQATRDGESFFASILRGFAGLGSQLAAAGAKNLLGQALGIDFGNKAKSAAGIDGLIGQGASFGGSSGSGTGVSYGYASATSASSFRALNDNLAKTSRSALDVARQFEGLNEKANTGVLDTFLQASGNWKGLSARDTAWCAAFANAAIMQAGGQGTGSNLASSFLNWGQGTNTPKVGDVVVLRPQSRGASGHVGFVAGFGDGSVQIFGGNQSNAANTRSYSTREVVGYRTGAGTGVAANQNVAGASDSIFGTSAREYQRLTARGVQDGLRSYGGPAPSQAAQTAMANGWSGMGPAPRMPFGQTAMGALGAGIGIFGAGYQSGSPLQGGFSGAMGGYQAATALGFSGVAGGVLGAGLGILGGILGARQQRKEQHKQAAAQWESVRPAYEAFDASLTDKGVGGLRTYLTEQWGKLSEFMKVGGAAWKMGSGNSTAQFQSTGQKLFDGFNKMLQEFREGYESLVADLASGQGLQGAFSRGRAATRDLKKQIQATRDDIDIAFGNVADIAFMNSPEAMRQAEETEAARANAIDRYNRAAGEYALSLLYQGNAVSEVVQTLEGFKGTAAGLHDVFKDLGWGADEAAAAINDRLNRALAGVAQGLNESIRDRIEDLAGFGYFSSVRTFLAEFETLEKDVAAAGADPSGLSDLFRRQLQAIVDGAELTGTAFTDLIAQFPALAGVVREFTETAVAASATEIRDAIKSYEERLFQAQHAGDELALFDRRAAQERLDAARFGADGLAALEAALAAERLNIGEQMQTAYRSFLDSRLSEATSARAEAESALRAEYERTVDRIRGIADFLKGIALDDNTSILSGQQQFEEAQRIYRETLFKANGGDVAAQEALLGVGQDYLEEAKAYYATSEAYGDVYREIESTLKASSAKMETELDVARRQASFLAEIADGTKGLGGLLKEYLEAVQKQLGAQKLVDGNRSFGLNPERNRLIDAGFRQVGLNFTGNYGLQADGSNPLDVWFKALTPEQRAIAQGVVNQYIGINRAAGGLVTGPGTSTSDSIRANLSNGEYVVKASTVDTLGVPFFDRLNQTARLPEVAMPRSFSPAGNDNAAVVAALREELGAMRAELRLLREDTKASGREVKGAVEDGNRKTGELAAPLKRVASRL